MIVTKRDFLKAMLGTSVIAVLPKVPTIADAAPVLEPYPLQPIAGWTYQWVACSVMGEPTPMNVQARLNNGWTFVEPNNQPVPATDIEEAINGGGLILMQKQTALIEPPKPHPMPTLPGHLWQDNKRTAGGLYVTDDFVQVPE